MDSQTGNKFEINPALVESYSHEEQEKQPFRHPYLARFAKDPFELIYLAIAHSNQFESKTFVLIRKAFGRFSPKIVLIEGHKRACGENSPLYTKWLEQKSDTFLCEAGEPGLTAQLAWERNIPFCGVEPTDKEIFEKVIESGYSLDDFLGFYFVREIPWRKQTGSISRDGASAIFSGVLKSTLRDIGLAHYSEFSYEQFLNWYRFKHNGEFDPVNISQEDTVPLADGKLITQRISHLAMMARDRYIVGIISEQLSTYLKVLIVMGGSHLTVQRKAIESAMGKPVYQGLLDD